MVGIELIAPDVYKKLGGKGLTGLAGKILNLTEHCESITPRLLISISLG